MADCKGFVTVGEYEDGRPGEMFIRVSKQGSTLAGIMDAFAISVSHGLQYGVPLRAFVETFTNMRFEPAGMTDDPDIRFAELADGLHLPPPGGRVPPLEERAELGILTVGERMQPTLPGVEETVVETRRARRDAADPPSIASASSWRPDRARARVRGADRRAEPGHASAPPRRARRPASDAPMCMQCGVQMQRAGSCHACPSCGTTSGCS